MKISQRVDKVIDQSEIESKYLWDFSISSFFSRINLSTLTADFSQPRGDLLSIKILSNLPNNQIFGFKAKQFGIEHLFISDENLNIKEIKTIPKHLRIEYYILSCFYDDSIFIFEKWEDLITGAIWDYGPERYLISQNKWIKLSSMPFEFPRFCIGFNQKIITVGKTPGIWIYDLFINSYTNILVNDEEIDDKEEQTLIKLSGKLYLIILSNINKIYCCDDPLSDWTIVHKFKGQRLLPDLISGCNYHIYYENSLYYYLRDFSIYRFDLANYKTKKVGNINAKLFGDLD